MILCPIRFRNNKFDFDMCETGVVQQTAQYFRFKNYKIARSVSS